MAFPSLAMDIATLRELSGGYVLRLKFFRGGQAPSGNLLLIGQPSSIDKDATGQCLCSQSAQAQCPAPKSAGARLVVMELMSGPEEL